MRIERDEGRCLPYHELTIAHLNIRIARIRLWQLIARCGRAIALQTARLALFAGRAGVLAWMGVDGPY